MSKTTKRKSRSNFKTELNGVCSELSDKCDTSEDMSKASVDANNTIALNVINELNDLIIAKRDLIIESFASKRGPIGRHQIKEYLNQMIEVVDNKRNEILDANCVTTKTKVSKTDCKSTDEKSNKSQINSISNTSHTSDQILEKSSSTKPKTKSKTKSIQKSTKRRKSVGRKGIGKLLTDYRNRNRIPDYQKRLKYVEKDPTIDILNKRIGLTVTRLSTISESEEF